MFSHENICFLLKDWPLLEDRHNVLDLLVVSSVFLQRPIYPLIKNEGRPSV